VEGADHDVVGLEVAVDDAAGVGEVDGGAGLEEDLDAGAEVGIGGLALVVGLTDVGDDALEGLAADELHGVADGAVVAVLEGVDGDDAGVVELGADRDLGVEAAGRGVLGAEGLADALDGDVALEVEIAGDVDLAHGPLGEEPEEAVARS
jgi:hypothetical protein